MLNFKHPFVIHHTLAFGQGHQTFHILNQGDQIHIFLEHNFALFVKFGIFFERSRVEAAFTALAKMHAAERSPQAHI